MTTRPRPKLAKKIISIGRIATLGPTTFEVDFGPSVHPPVKDFDREELSDGDLARLHEGARVIWTRGLHDEGGTRERFSVLEVQEAPREAAEPEQRRTT